ncbi:MAG: S8 family serine peptidase, partial [Acidimicrobiales bacterium]|nr:S8 family serine peptidase [Acidimicrobiales bacterium]
MDPHDTVTRMCSPGRQLAGFTMLVLLALLTSVVAPSGGSDFGAATRKMTDVTGEPRSNRRELAVASEGLVGIGAPEWHEADHTGSGTRVAVIDLGFDGWDVLPDGELPSEVETAAFDSDGVLDTGTDHGTQMAEIIHDVAPGAALVLITFSDAYMAEMVDWLIATEVDVVSMSLEWTEGPLDGTHFSALEIERAIDAGITWVVAAGNSAKRHHVGTTVDNNENSWVELNGTSAEFNEFRLAANASADLLLTWNDKTTDLDLCVFDMEELSDGSPTQVMCAEDPQGNGEPAIEAMTLENNTGASRLYGYSLRFFSGIEVVYDTRIWGSSNLQFSNPAASIGVPANMANVLTVGAIAWDTEVLQPYSGWGPNQQGVLKPEVVAPDQVTTSQWAGASNTGSSYAAPHVAGIAALMIGAIP